jgi:hypothetical protein
MAHFTSKLIRSEHFWNNFSPAPKLELPRRSQGPCVSCDFNALSEFLTHRRSVFQTRGRIFENALATPEEGKLGDVNVENNQIWAELKDETDRFALLSAADFH